MLTVVRGSNFPVLLQLFKTGGVPDTIASVKYSIYENNGATLAVSEQVATYDPIFLGYYDKLDVSTDWGDQTEGNFLLTWTISGDSGGFPSVMVENLCVVPGGIVESTYTQTEYLRIMFSVLAGLSNGGGTGNLKFRDIADTKDRLSEVVDRKGNRTTTIYDGS